MSDSIVAGHDYRSRGDVSDSEFTAIMHQYRVASDESSGRLRGDLNLQYDGLSAERLDVWRPPNRHDEMPVVIAIHGGYWRMLSRHDTAFMAAALAKRGVATVTVDYTLAPVATLAEIVRQVRAAVTWVYRDGRKYGLDPSRIHVLGSSAGAHLAAMCVVKGWQHAAGVPENVVSTAMLLSGLFDLRPLVTTFANDWLNLDEESASSASPILAPPTDARLFIARAEHEATGFHYQSELFHSHWLRGGGRSESAIIPGKNHFDVFLDLADVDSYLSTILWRLIQHDR